MKKLLLGAILVMVATTASAQLRGPIQFGVKAGLITDNIDIRKGGKSAVSRISSDADLGWQVGIVSRINLPMFHIQPEIQFNMHRYDLQAVTGGQVSKADVKINTVDVPVLMGLRLLMLRFQAGPVFNLMTDTKVKNNSGGFKHYVDVNRPSVSLAAGVGVDLWKLNFDVRYHGNLKRVEQDIQVGDNATNHTYKSTFNNWTFSLAYMF